MQFCPKGKFLERGGRERERERMREREKERMKYKIYTSKIYYTLLQTL